MKYIIFEDFSGKPIPVLFPERIGFEELREQMPYGTILSGGFVELVGSAFRCHGEAGELGAASSRSDETIILDHFSAKD